MDMLSTAASKMERPKPNLHLSDKDLPESKEWETGKSYTVKATIKKVGHSEDMFGGKDKNISSRFEVHKISPFEAYDEKEYDDEKSKEKPQRPGKGEGSQDNEK